MQGVEQGQLVAQARMAPRDGRLHERQPGVLEGAGQACLGRAAARRAREGAETRRHPREHQAGRVQVDEDRTERRRLLEAAQEPLDGLPDDGARAPFSRRVPRRAARQDGDQTRQGVGRASVPGACRKGRGREVQVGLELGPRPHRVPHVDRELAALHGHDGLERLPALGIHARDQALLRARDHVELVDQSAGCLELTAEGPGALPRQHAEPASLEREEVQDADSLGGHRDGPVTACGEPDRRGVLRGRIGRSLAERTGHRRLVARESGLEVGRAAARRRGSEEEGAERRPGESAAWCVHDASIGQVRPGASAVPSGSPPSGGAGDGPAAPGGGVPKEAATRSGVTPGARCPGTRRC
jgi:hypothetical protein